MREWLRETHGPGFETVLFTAPAPLIYFMGASRNGNLQLEKWCPDGSVPRHHPDVFSRVRRFFGTPVRAWRLERPADHATTSGRPHTPVYMTGLGAVSGSPPLGQPAPVTQP